MMPHDTNGSTLELFMRPEDVQVRSTRADDTTSTAIELGRGRVRDVLYAGSQIEHVIDFGGVNLLALSAVDRVSRLEPGNEVTVRCPMESMLIYADGRLASHGR